MKFYDLCQDLFLYQHVNQLTRARGSDTPSTLDVVFSRNKLEVDEIQYKASIGSSDHAVLTFNYMLENGNCIEGTKMNKLDYFKADYDGMRQHLRLIHWKDLLEHKPVEEMWNLFVSM